MKNSGQVLSRRWNRLVGEDTLAGVIVTSAKETFLAGADLDSLIRADDPAQLFTEVERLKGEFRRLETLGVPVVAALNGTALGRRPGTGPGLPPSPIPGSEAASDLAFRR